MEEIIGSDDFDDERVIDVAPNSCNIQKISVNPESCNYVNNYTKYCDLQDDIDEAGIKRPDNSNTSGYQPHNANNEVQIKHEVVSDSDIEVDLAYRVIDTFNVYKENTFKVEGENTPQNTESSLKIKQEYDHTQTTIKVEVDNQTDIETGMDRLDYMMNNKSVARSKEDISLEKESVDYETLNLEDDWNKNIAEQLQSKGM